MGHHEAYVRSRARAEAAVLAANLQPYTQLEHRGRLRTIVLRAQLCYGPRGRFLPEIVGLTHGSRRRKTSPSITCVVGDGKNLVDPVHIDSSAWAHVLADDALRRDSSSASGRAFVIGGGEPVPLWHMLNTFFGLLGYSQLPMGSYYHGMLQWVATRIRELLAEGSLGSMARYGTHCPMRQGPAVLCH